MDLASAVHRRCALLVNAVPVDAGGLIAQQVVHVYDDTIAGSSTQLRAGPYPID